MTKHGKVFTAVWYFPAICLIGAQEMPVPHSVTLKRRKEEIPVCYTISAREDARASANFGTSAALSKLYSETSLEHAILFAPNQRALPP